MLANCVCAWWGSVSARCLGALRQRQHVPAALLSKRSEGLPKKTPGLGFDVAGGGVGRASSDCCLDYRPISVPEAALELHGESVWGYQYGQDF